MEQVLLSLGSNKGDRRRWMEQMEARLREILCPPVRVSSLMETAPLGVDESHSAFLNRVLTGGWDKDPVALLASCERIERELGRTDKGLYAPRTADIDILLFGDRIVHEPRLVIPHPRMLERRFCIEGCAQLSPELMHPVEGRTCEQIQATMPSAVREQTIRFL
jgi:2-amino-4-hydroxy-6-hydroxymethyldihydropteridine diphosphokinase